MAEWGRGTRIRVGTLECMCFTRIEYSPTYVPEDSSFTKPKGSVSHVVTAIIEKVSDGWPLYVKLAPLHLQRQKEHNYFNRQQNHNNYWELTSVYQWQWSSLSFLSQFLDLTCCKERSLRPLRKDSAMQTQIYSCISLTGDSKNHNAFPIQLEWEQWSPEYKVLAEISQSVHKSPSTYPVFAYFVLVGIMGLNIHNSFQNPKIGCSSCSGKSVMVEKCICKFLKLNLDHDIKLEAMAPLR